MENPQFLKKRLIAIAKAALLGAVVGIGLILLDLATSWMWKHGYLSKFWYDFFADLAMVQAIAAAFFIGTPEGGVALGCLINAIQWGLVFAVVAGFWQFAIKNYEK